MLSVASLCLSLALTAAVPQVEPREVGPVPEELREALSLSPFYEKHVSVHGLPVLSSGAPSDFALLEAAYLIDRMIGHRPEILREMARRKTRFVVMGAAELTTAVPEHSDLRPSKYWDRRARGLGATRARPVVSCGEENLLGYPGDPYSTENILIHEFAHAIHQMALEHLDATFDARLKEAYDAALAAGLWKDKYAATNTHEYWAEAVQSWFGTNRENDHDHNHVDTRAELVEYDPRVADLCREVFGDQEWSYVKPALREKPGHLAGFDGSSAPRFAWPAELEKWYAEYERAQEEARKKKR